MLLKEYVVHILKRERIPYVFMVPGGVLGPISFEMFNDPDITPVIAAHEGGAAFMADGYSRSSNHFGVCAAIGGPGITNMVTAIMTAKMDCTPLLVLSGDVPVPVQGKGFLQDSSFFSFDIFSILDSITSSQAAIHEVDQLTNNIEQLLAKMFDPASRGPVHISLPLDIQNKNVNSNLYNNIDKHILSPKYADDNAISEAFSMLSESRRIVIFAGKEVRFSRSWEILTKFAEKYKIPVATTITGKGSISEYHELSLGVLGWVTNPYAQNIILEDDIDVLLCIGTELKASDTITWSKKFNPKKIIVNYTSLANIFHSRRYDLEILSDTFSFITKMLTIENEQSSALLQSAEYRLNWLNNKKEISNNINFFNPDNLNSDGIPIHPARLIKELRAVMPQNTVLVGDSGAHMLFGLHYWTVTDPTQIMTSLDYTGPMGWAIPASIGSSFALPDRPHVCLTGDGCMLMHGIEIKTAVQYKQPIIFIVCNNRAFGNPRLRAEYIGEKEAGFMDILPYDYAMFARSLGAEGFTVEQPEQLKSVIENAYKLNTTVLIDVIVDNVPTPTEIFDGYFFQRFGKE